MNDVAIYWRRMTKAEVKLKVYLQGFLYISLTYVSIATPQICWLKTSLWVLQVSSMLQKFCSLHVHLIFEGDAGDVHTVPSTPCLDLGIYNDWRACDLGFRVCRSRNLCWWNSCLGGCDMNSRRFGWILRKRWWILRQCVQSHQKMVR